MIAYDPPLLPGYYRLTFRSGGKSRRCWVKEVTSERRHYHWFWVVTAEGQRTDELLVLHDLDIVSRLVAVLNTKYGLLEIWRAHQNDPTP